jgi:hypothetical protein
VLRILPLNGKIAWNELSRHCFAEPPAEFPSTMYISVPFFPFLEQSESLPGSTQPKRADFLNTVSFAILAANLALAESMILAKIVSNASSFSLK